MSNKELKNVIDQFLNDLDTNGIPNSTKIIAKTVLDGFYYWFVAKKEKDKLIIKMIIEKEKIK